MGKVLQLAVPGARLGDVGHAVQKLAEDNGYGVIRDFVGHAALALPSRGPRWSCR